MDANTYDATLTQAETANAVANTGIFLMGGLFVLFILLVGVVAGWKVFKKAGQPGWASLVPIYNLVVWMRIIHRPTWWVLLLFVPFVGIVISLMMYFELGKAFGKSTAFNIVGMILFSGIGLLMLAFGKAQYQLGAPAAPADPQMPAPQPPMPQPPVAPANPV